MSEVKLHVANLDHFFAGATEAANRVDAGDDSEQEGVIAFESMELLLKVLTANRWQLLRILSGHSPTSIRHLAKLLQRDYRGVHADVTSLLDVGLIMRTESGKIMLPWRRISVQMDTDLAA
jgi:predicted transcriptional regulator